MAIVLVEEVLMGLDEVKLSLEQALLVLEDMTDDIRPDVGDNLKATLEQTLIQPLQSRMTALDALLEDLATAA